MIVAERMAGLGGPRELEPSFRHSLERALVDGGSSLWGIDVPRDMPSDFRRRLELALAPGRRRVRRTLMSVVAAAAVVTLVAGTSVFLGRRGEVPSRKAAELHPSASPSPLPPRPGRATALGRFASAESFLRYVRERARGLAGSYGLVGVDIREGVGGAAPDGSVPSALPPKPLAKRPDDQATPGFSSTNVQEKGVDEPDTVETDGRRLAIMFPGKVRVLRVGAHRASLIGSLEIKGGIGIVIDGDRLIHFSAGYNSVYEGVSLRPWTKVTIIDISSPVRPKIVSSLDVEGAYVGARVTDGLVRLIVQSSALGPPLVTAANWNAQSHEQALEENRRLIDSSLVGHWVPHYIRVDRDGTSESGHVHDWETVRRAPEHGGLSMLTVLTIDPTDPRPGNAISVLGAGEIVYASPTSLYVTSTLDPVGRPQGTRIHKFDISGQGVPRYLASGIVAGSLLNQFSMSEHEYYLRVASTRWQSVSEVTILRQEGGKLVPVGRVGDLGRGERIRSVRFIREMGYVVTFREVDPLFVIDLENPTNPEVKGELKVPGFSSYLHPARDDLIIGLGRDVDGAGSDRGIQLSLFDVSDPSRPRRRDSLTLPGATTSVGDDHHAFLYWEPAGLVAFPATVPLSRFARLFGALVIRFEPGAGFGEVVKLAHGDRADLRGSETAISRLLVVGNDLISVSEAGVLMSDLATLEDVDWVPLG